MGRLKGLTDKVRLILEKTGINEAPIPLKKIADYFSIKVIPYDNFPDSISGTIITNEDGSVTIGVNSKNSKVRQRFTIAHEMGHFFLGHDIKSQIVDDHLDKSTDREKEANKFAAELLMPKNLFINDIKNKISIPELAKKYNVSEQSVSIRILDPVFFKKLNNPSNNT